MSEQVIEKDWTTKAGLRAVVLMTSMGHRCGYVGVPVGHPLHGIEYSQPTEALAPPADDEPVGKRGAISILIAATDPDRLQSPEIVFNVHGGLTYSNNHADYPAQSGGLWWFGYDCAHHGDARSDDYIASIPEEKRWLYQDGGEHRALAYCEAECESLAEQIVRLTKVPA